MLASKLREKTEKQLISLKDKTKKQIEDLRLSAIKGEEQNLRKIRTLKREYARILTVLNEKGENK